MIEEAANDYCLRLLWKTEEANSGSLEAKHKEMKSD